MLAYRRVDIAALNSHARIRMLTSGQLTGPTLQVHSEDLGERSFQAGDQVLLRRNDYQLGVRNGDRATILSVDPGHGVGHRRGSTGATRPSRCPAAT